MDANTAAVFWVAGFVVALTVVALIWLLRRSMRRRR
jgi:membrane protein implicated in regulation of membrane protease activity